MNRHNGRFPKRELARIWRELIVATIGFEGPFSMAIYYTETETGFWDLARDQYGTNTPASCFADLVADDAVARDVGRRAVHRAHPGRAAADDVARDRRGYPTYKQRKVGKPQILWLGAL